MDSDSDVVIDERDTHDVSTLPAFSAADHEDLLLLRWFACHQPALMTDEAWHNLSDLEKRRRQRQKAEEAAYIGKWGARLTAATIADLERRLSAGEDLTAEEEQQWAAAVLLAQKNRNRADFRQLERWTATPLDELVFPLMARSEPRPRVATRSLRRPRGRNSRRARSPGRKDDDPHDLAERRRA